MYKVYRIGAIPSSGFECECLLCVIICVYACIDIHVRISCVKLICGNPSHTGQNKWHFDAQNIVQSQNIGIYLLKSQILNRNCEKKTVVRVGKSSKYNELSFSPGCRRKKTPVKTRTHSTHK